MGEVGRHWAARLVKCASLALLLVLLVSASGSTMDRAELGKLIKAIPPNGPFWRYGNVTMRARSRKAGLDPVVFSHWSHRARYTCRVCHQELGFSMRAGDTGITRAQYLSGKYCGACHNGNTAFTVADSFKPQCKRCHMENTKALQQQFTAFAAPLPMAPFGNGIDWAAALKDGQISQLNAIDPKYTPLKLPENLRKPLKLGTAQPRSDVRFSHEDHAAEMDCSSCHPDIFAIKKKTTEAFTMDSNIYGQFCGACHMLVAFPMNDCRRCHPSMSNSSF
jgi:c(7)-type cytochrome triheme protein